MYKTKFSYDGDDDPGNYLEGFSAETGRNGYCSVYMTRQQAAAWLDGTPYDYRFLEAGSPLNKSSKPGLLIYLEDGERAFKSFQQKTEDGRIEDLFRFEGFSFVEVGESKILF